MGRLENKVAVITGGVRGMGASHVRRFVQKGANVVLGDVVLKQEGTVLQKELGTHSTFVPTTSPARPAGPRSSNAPPPTSADSTS